MKRVSTALAWALLPAELVLVVCLVAGARVPAPVLATAEAAVALLLLAHGVAWIRLRRRGLTAREALHRLLPEPVLRLVGHELRLMTALVRWVARRPHGVGAPGALAFPHARDQAALMYGFAFVCLVETVGMSYLLADLPVVHAVVLVLDVYTVAFVLGLHAASVTRPHVLTADALRVRQAAHVDVRIPLDRIAAVRRETLFTHEKAEGELNLAVGSQTSVTLELTEPVDAPRLLGAPRPVRTVRLHADDAGALVRELGRALERRRADEPAGREGRPERKAESERKAASGRDAEPGRRAPEPSGPEARPGSRALTPERSRPSPVPDPPGSA